MGLNKLEDNWDLVVLGGGITGAGVFREATRMGLKVLLVEQKDFAWGASSRSSKMVHGGLRYLKQGKFLLTRDAIKQRDRLMVEGSGLVNPLRVAMPIYRKSGPGKWIMELGLFLYDLLAWKRQYKFFKSNLFKREVPSINQDDLQGGFEFFDAQTDDARLVLRLIYDSVSAGGTALNYTKAKEILRDEAGQVTGVLLEDSETGETRTVQAAKTINATGSWVEKLHPSPTKQHIRPLRGSHLIFPANKIPVDRCVGFVNPEDNRPVFVYPWEGAVLVGTTDLDHGEDLVNEPHVSGKEVKYIMRFLKTAFPESDIRVKDCIASISGIRPVLSSDDSEDPSKESREHVIWEKQGLVTVTGGKLTTFRTLAWDALKASMPEIVKKHESCRREPIFSGGNGRFDSLENRGVSEEMWTRLYGRYGESAYQLVAQADQKDLTLIEGTNTLWAEIPYAAKYEQIHHLSDLLLRRVRIGLLIPEGGKKYMKRIRSMCAAALPWDAKRWDLEIKDYMALWKRSYSIPR